MTRPARRKDSARELLHRLNRIQGQIEGLKRALQDESDCLAMMGQVKAVHSAIKHFGEAYVGVFVDRCTSREGVSGALRREFRTVVGSAFAL